MHGSLTTIVDPERTDLAHVTYADALRTLAIALVVGCHVYYFTYPPVTRTSVVVFYAGNWGLNCFFVLSGMLIGRPYLKSLLNSEPLPSLANFYRRRFYRVYPLYITAVILSVPLATAATGHVPSIINIGLHCLILQTLNVRTAVSLNGPMWTMGVDIAFYLLLPLAASCFAIMARGRSKRFVAYAIIALIAVGTIAGLVYRLMIFMVVPKAITDFATETVFVRNVVGFAPSFCFGFGLVLLNLRRTRLERLAASMIVVAGATVGVVEIVSRSGVGAFLVRLVYDKESVDKHLLIVFANALHDPVLACSSALVLFGCTQYNSRRLSRAANSMLIVRASRISYAVYLIHYPIIEVLDRHVLRGELGHAAFIRLALISSVIIIPVAEILHIYVERPFLVMRDRRVPSVTPS